MEHSTLPWTVSKDGLPEKRNQCNWIECANGELVAYGQLTDADATFIVRACNAHDDLVRVLKAIVAADDAAMAELRAMGAPLPPDAATLTEAARAALAKAGEPA